MLTISDHLPNHTCAGFSRRDFLRVGALGMGGLSLAHLLQAKAEAGTGSEVLRDKAVVLLFLQGGPPHIEFFDPKMSAPAEIRSITGEIQTCLPGVTFGSTFPKLAARADRFSIVRSYGSGNAGHTYNEVLSARNPSGATISSIYARVRGNNHPQSGLPTNVVVLPEAARDGLKFGNNFETGALPTLTQAGSFGPIYSAFDPSGGSNLKRDMQMGVTPERFADRRSLLQRLDGLRRAADYKQSLASLDTYQQQAFEMITRGVSSAFDVSKEDPRTIERYDTSHLFRMEELNRWGDMRRTSNLLGRQMLMARRLVESGCGFVTVSDCGWDYHANGNSPKNMAGIHPMGGQVDHAVSAFLDDVYERGLSDKILLVVTGEMGRSPRLNNNGGRDHYGELTPLLLAGGGIKGGRIIGQTDNFAMRSIDSAFRPEHLLGTIMHTLFDVANLRLERQLPSEIISLADSAKPISQLF